MMRRVIRSPCLVLLLVALRVVGAEAQSADARMAARVDSILSRMTVEEKAGQMTMLTIGAVAAEGGPQGDSIRLDSAKLHHALVERHAGSLLNVLGGPLTAEGWHALLAQVQRVATGRTRLGVPVLYGIDLVHGANYTRGGTLFPHNIGLAAAFDTALARSVAEATRREALAAGLQWNFAPVLDLGRNPVFPRFYETFGEDPRVAAMLGAASVEGLQRGGGLAATLKHYLAYSAAESGRDRTPADISEREVREHHLPPFAAGVRAGAATVMVNSGEVDGVPLHASRYWLTEVLRGELGFQGVVVSDWEDVYFLHTRHRVAPTLREAVRMAVEAGIDVSMTPNDFVFTDHLIALVRDGVIPESRLDQSVRRILLLKARLGLLDLPVPAVRPQPSPASHGALAREAARRTITLLKNEGDVLPLRPEQTILVTGPAAASLTALSGGWSYTWQGTDAGQFPEGPRTLVESMLRRGRDVRYLAGGGFTEAGDLGAVRRAAAEADVVVVAIGEDAYAEWLGNLDDLTLPEAQLRLVEAAQAAGKPVVLVLIQGRPRIISRVEAGARGVVMAYWPGPEGAEAIAEVLFGETNPSGRLPFTYPRHPNALLTYDHRHSETTSARIDRGPGGFNPQWEFGHGLSYTCFEYRGLRLSRDAVAAGDTLEVRVTVTNRGRRPGREAVLLFSRQHFASVTPPVRRLRAFESISLDSGESREVTLRVPATDLAFIGRDGREVLEPGAFDVMVGGLTQTFQVTTGATLRGGGGSGGSRPE